MRTSLLSLVTVFLALHPGVCSCILCRSFSLFNFNFDLNIQPILGNNLLELMKAAKLTTALEAVQFAGLEDVLSGEGPFTMFLPENEGFEKLPEGVTTNKGEGFIVKLSPTPVLIVSSFIFQKNCERFCSTMLSLVWLHLLPCPTT